MQLLIEFVDIINGPLFLCLISIYILCKINIMMHGKKYVKLNDS